MPTRSTVNKAKRDLRAGKRPSTAAGEFVQEEIEHVRQGKHGARSSRQAIAIGLSKARRAGVPLKAPQRGAVSERTRRAAARDVATGQGVRKARPASAKRKRASSRALAREKRGAVSSRALSQQAKRASGARRRAKR
jgi:hypothetical protein